MNLNGKLKRVSFSDCGVLDFKYPEVPYITISNSEIDFSNIEFGKVKSKATPVKELFINLLKLFSLYISKFVYL